MSFWIKPNCVNIEELKGQVLSKVYLNDYEDELHFETVTGNHYKMRHEQDCCESVTLDDICGDLNDLIGSEILVAEEVSGTIPNEFDPKQHESYTWTFYKIDTAKGGVTLRWFGASNGYYSESVDFVKVN